jgi:phycobilisome core-membrane linker protein
MLNSSEYNESFGEDTVPFERFITPADRNARQVPSFNRSLKTAAYVEPAGLRPDVTPPQALRSTGDLIQRNLTDRNRVVVGSWAAQLSGGAVVAPPSSPSPSQGPGSIRQDPAPTRRWRPTTIGKAAI